MATYLKNAPRNILWFKQAHDRGELEMKPPFQRNPVWTEKQKSFLIDSILNEYPVPEIYMQELVSDTGTVQYVIVDGQQRIRACLEFVNNEFSIDAKDSPQWGGLSFDDLKSHEKKRIYEYDFIARYLPDIPDTEIRAIFQRLNRNNVVLNPQELRQATYWGYFINTMNEISEIEAWGKLDIFTSNDIKRMLDVEFISELTIALLHGLQNKKQTIDKYYALYEIEFDRRNYVKEIFYLVLSELSSILPLLRSTQRWYKKTDFYSLFIILAKHKNILPMNHEKREMLASILDSFGEKIDKMVSIARVEEEADAIVEAESSENVSKYVQGIRASSDLGSRRRRDEALESELSPLLEVK